MQGQLSLRAMSLVYTTMLSLVPLLAVTFSVLKAFGVHNQLEPFLDNLLAPLGPRGSELSDRVIEFVGNVQVGVLGAVGLALLFYTVVSLLQKIEDNMNFIWRVNRSRGLAQRFSEYLSVILVGPVLIFAALGITASITSTAIVQKLLTIEPIGAATYFAGRLIPYVLVSAAFVFIYSFVPNTRVMFASALTGGIVAGLLWQTVGWLFASFVAASAKYAAIYSSFAVIILSMIWLYVSWLILLVGAQVAYYHQHPQLSRERIEGLPLSGRVKERLALLVMFLIAYNHYQNRSLWTTESLAACLALSENSLQVIIDDLSRAGFVLQTADDPAAYVPARDIEKITVKALFDAVRKPAPGEHIADDTLYSVASINRLIECIDDAVAGALGASTIKSLVLEHQESAQEQPAASTNLTSDKRRTAY
ncbi:MAG: YhjD/YihY/BrkB family envelope integrity protein [Acidiferrobacterales bacterium]